MKVIAFYDAKPYDKIYFDQHKSRYGIEIMYLEEKLNAKTAVLAEEADAVVAFVNDEIDKKTIDKLINYGIKVIAMRCAGYNNVDVKACEGRITVLRVPAYSPYAVAEYTMCVLLMLDRKLHRAYNRTREHNFSLNGLMGFDLHGKTIGVIGTGKIGRVFIDICKGFGMEVLAYDPYPTEIKGVMYVELDELCEKSDIISLHCPLTKSTKYIINENTISRMKKGVYIINTSRGALIDSEALLKGLVSEKIGAAGLDVYEEETGFFYEDYSDSVVRDDLLTSLISLPNVLITSHQAFFTKEALENIAVTTLENVHDFFEGKELPNKIESKQS